MPLEQRESHLAPPALIVLIIVGVLLSVFPSVNAASLEITLFDVPAALALIWLGIRRAVLLVGIGAITGLALWGHSECYHWTALYGNSLLMVFTIHLATRQAPWTGIKVMGLAYWVFIGTPLTFLVFWVQFSDADYAVVATGQRLFGGIAAITLSVAIHFLVLLAQHQLPSSFFGRRAHFTVRMRDVAGSAAVIATSIPLLLSLWAYANHELESRIEALFAASDARFETLAQTASANLAKQRSVFNRLAGITSQIQTLGREEDSREFEENLFKALNITGARGLVVEGSEDADLYISDNVLNLIRANDGLTGVLAAGKSSSVVLLSEDPNGPTALIISKAFPQLVVVFDSSLALWESLYRADMLGLMGSAATGGIIDRVSHFHGPSSHELYGIAEESRIIREEYDYAIWIPPARAGHENAKFSYFLALKNSYITFQASDELINSFDPELYDVDCFRYTLDFWSYIDGALQSISLLILVGAVLLLLMTGLIEFTVAKFSAPFVQLTDAMDRFAQSSSSSNRASYSFDLDGATNLFRRLATGFNDMENEVSAGTARMQALNLSYEALLTQAKLAFIAEDKNGFTVFSNPAAEPLLTIPDHWVAPADKLLESSDVAPLTLQHNGQTMDLLIAQAPRINPAGEDDGRWLIISDVSSLKATERKLLEAQRLSILGQLTTNMAHEINQPLQAMTLGVANLRRLLKEPLADNPKAAEKLNVFDQQLHKIAGLIKFMKNHGGQGSTRWVQFNPVTVTSGVIDDHDSDETGNLQVQLIDDLEGSCQISGDPEQFELVLRHLVKNAADAAEHDQSAASHTLTLRAYEQDDNLVISASDDCGGIATESLPSIFDPFYTTKDPDKGIGLGLSISQGIIKSMNGEIHARNSKSGAVFTIKLPLA